MFDLWQIAAWFKKTFKAKDLIFIGLIVLAYFVTRLINLETFPIFTDEGIYIHWARIAHDLPEWRFISLTDGKQVLQTWTTIPLIKLLPEHPLLAGRLFSVVSGFGALIGIYCLLFNLFNKKAAYIGSIFYILTPYFLFYDRMALVDSAVNAGFIWILFFSILLIRNLRFDLSLLFGIIAGISSLAKSSVRIFIGLSLLAPILVFETNLKKLSKKVLNYLFLYIISVVISIIIYNIQRVSPFLHFVTEKNKTFVMTTSEFLKTPFAYFMINVVLIPQFVFAEAAIILPIIGILGFWILFKKNPRLALYLLIWVVFPFIAIAFFAKIIFPRYLIFFATLFLITASYFLMQSKNKLLVSGLTIIYLISVLYYDYTIVFAQDKIPFPPVDKGQYIQGSPAGYGVSSILDFAREKAHEKPVILLAEGNFGLVGDMLDASLRKSDRSRVSVKGYWPLEEKSLAENQKLLKDYNIYIVFSHRTKFPTDWPMKFIAKYEKPGRKSAFFLFKLIENK